MSLGQADLDFWVWWPNKIPFILSPPPMKKGSLCAHGLYALGMSAVL